MGKLEIKKALEIDDELLRRILAFDRSLFPLSEDNSFPDGYFEGLYKNTRDLIVAILDDGEVIAYVNAIFLSNESFDNYLISNDYLSLENIGIRECSNYMYFYTIAIEEPYRDTSIIKILMSSFSDYLNKERIRGKIISRCITEVITKDGVNTAKRMGFVPVNVDEEELGIYEHPNIYSYINEMINDFSCYEIGNGGENMRILK